MPSLPVIQPKPPNALFHGYGARIRSILLRLYRLAVVIVIVTMIHRHYARLRIDGDAPITVSEVKPFLPTAARLATDESDRMGLFVQNAAGERIGYVLRTSPLSDKITGYAGPTDTLIALDREMGVLGIRIRHRAD